MNVNPSDAAASEAMSFDKLQDLAVLGGLGLLIGIGLLFLFVMLAVLAVNALNAVFVAALYHYAATGENPAGWDVASEVKAAQARAPAKK